MNKVVLMCGPFNTRSGYGDHCRSLFWALHDSNKYDIKIIDTRWGDTPRNFLKSDNERHKQVLDAILNEPQMERQPDIYIDIRIPQEWQQHGKYNIGITAGIETNAVSGVWLEGCNKMDLIIVPSEHSKMGFVNSIYDAMQNLPDGQQQKVGELKLQKPIEVLFEGIDEDIFKPLKVKDIKKNILNDINKLISEQFAFLFVGQWVKGGYGEDRKDIGRMIKVFLESFANKKKQPALILKTSGATFSIMDREEITQKILLVKNQFPSDWVLPKVYLLHGDLTDDEMNSLYNHPKIKAMISFTHGEGFGRPLLEATMTGLPVVATNWSGQVDFLDSDKSILLPGKLEQVPKSAVWKDIVIPESKWFVVNEHEAYKALTFVFNNYIDEIKQKATNLMNQNREKFTLKKMANKFVEIVEQYTKDLPTTVGLKLPKLKKVNDDSKPPQIKLPKLKKITEDAE